METTKLHNATDNFSYPELENELSKKHQSLLEDATLKAKHYAKKNQPSLRGDSLIHFISGFASKYDEMAAMIRQKIQAENTGIDVQMLSDAADEKTRKLHDKKNAVQTSIHNLELDIAQKNIKWDVPAPTKKVKDHKILWILIPMTIGEIAYNTFSWQGIGDALVYAILISLGITGGLYLLGKFIGEQLKQDSSGLVKKVFIGSGIVIGLAVCYLLAILRAKYLNEESSTEISPLWMFAVNAMFLLITIWAYYKFSTSAEEIETYNAEKQRYDDTMKYKNELDQLNQQADQLEQEIEQIAKETKEQLRVILHKPAYEKALVQRIHKWKQECIETFKSVNLSHRGDHGVPSCFSQTTDPSDHYYQTT